MDREKLIAIFHAHSVMLDALRRAKLEDVREGRGAGLTPDTVASLIRLRRTRMIDVGSQIAHTKGKRV